MHRRDPPQPSYFASTYPWSWGSNQGPAAIDVSAETSCFGHCNKPKCTFCFLALGAVLIELLNLNSNSKLGGLILRAASSRFKIYHQCTWCSNVPWNFIADSSQHARSQSIFHEI